MTVQPLRIDERNHVEKPLLDQLAGLGWDIVDLDNKQRPADSFGEVVMLPVLREQIEVINPWLEEDQVEEAIRRLTAGFPGTGLLENNRHVFQILRYGDQRGAGGEGSARLFYYNRFVVATCRGLPAGNFRHRYREA